MRQMIALWYILIFKPTGSGLVNFFALFLDLVLRFGSPDFKVFSYGPISIKFGMRVHLMVLYAANDCIMIYFNF